jgi:hypothetical protein
MPYREPLTRQTTPVRYGLTPPRWWRVWLGLLLVGLGGLLLIFALGVQSLRCTRSADGGGACELKSSYPFSELSGRFGPGAVRDVRYNKITGKSGRVTGAEVVLLDSRGAETELRWFEPDAASAAYERAHAFFVERRGGSLDLATDRSFWLFFVCAAMILGGLAALASGLRWAGRVGLLIDRVEGRLYITRRSLRRRESWAVSLSGVTAVEVERGPLDPKERVPAHGARLALYVEETGKRLPLTPFLPGERVHRRAAAALRSALELPEAREPGGLPWPQWFNWSRLRRPMLAALGLLLVAVVGQLVLLRYASTTQGWLSLRCEARCRFAGIECLPGGEVSMSLDPGEYTVEVFAPDAPGGYAPHRISLKADESVSFLCAPER